LLQLFSPPLTSSSPRQFASICTILLVIALVEGTFDIKEKIKLDREFEVARLQNAEWRARIGQSSRTKNTCGRGRRKEELT